MLQGHLKVIAHYRSEQKCTELNCTKRSSSSYHKTVIAIEGSVELAHDDILRYYVTISNCKLGRTVSLAVAYVRSTNQ